ncbi:MAG: hypothetical protein WDO72_08645 [Pseudomonadota bacterium]
MRHPGNWIAVRVSLAVLAATCGLTGCGADGSNPKDISIDVPDENGVLRKVRSASELEGLLKGTLPEATPGVTTALMAGTPPAMEDFFYANRSSIDGDAVWYVHDGADWSSQRPTPEQVQGLF